jgi:predicted helicase
MKFDSVLEKYRKYAFSEKDKGTRFERLMQAYLRTDPKYAHLLKHVWLWNEFPGRHDFGGTDTGIDLVALTVDGDYWAVQCKCYQESAVIDKPAVDSFLATSSRGFKDESLRTTRFAHRMWISTTNHWGANATEAIKNQNPPVTRLNLFDLQEAPVDWEKLEQGIHGEASRLAKKVLRPHQKEALERTHAYFKTAERGKLIMACGTGKTFNALRIAEHETNGKGFILFLVPSISLLSQSLREWAADANEPINAVCICSDPEVSRKRARDEDSDLTSVIDLALPASTNVHDILNQFRYIQANGHTHRGMTVVFATYQSIEVVAKVQKELLKAGGGLGVFDLTVCDEAHRTTGVTLLDEDESAFTKVHDDDFIRSKKRLYMTATPRLFSDDTKSKAAQADAVLCSMDDPELYGEEIYRIGFGEAVERDLLTDYRVLILTLNEHNVPPAIQQMVADKSTEINTDDASKLIGCINALSKQVLGDEGLIASSDPDPMRRAVAFCQTIAVSRKITNTFNATTEVYIESLPEERRGQMTPVASRHIDGTMSAPIRDEMLGWLKSDAGNGECRILTNVRCLSEGVDVPSLDAVMFLSARNSQVDVVQSVGRVMRKAPGKKYGYIIIPVVVPSNVEPDKALDDNERYKVVWTVLNALRAHDDRFNATINKIELNHKRPGSILVVGTKDGETDHGNAKKAQSTVSQQLALQFEQLQHVVFARMVQKVGDRRYWEQWAKNVAEIAERQVERISRLITETGPHQQAFQNFLGGLRKNINPSISQQEAVEMLSQHIITKPVFEALFEGYSFVQHNPISVSMQTMLDLLEAQSIEKDTATLQRFYDSVRKRASGIDNAEGRQRVIIELYDKFFKTAFPKMVERLGIVYTPVEIVDFMLHSVDDLLRQEFGRSLSDENVHLLDPFAGTGTFTVRLLQSGLIARKDLVRKYTQEIHANEIVLLAYYIAAVNIENAFHDAMGDETEYRSFDGICLTDTFQLGESDGSDTLYTEMFPQNSARVARQKKAPLRVIWGNPPYSVGQRSANDNAQNQKYPVLDGRIEETYSKESSAGLSKSLYDAYIKAFRWASDRLDDTHGGIICFVSNGGWIDGNAQDGLRNCFEREFSSIYVFNLRGNARTQGELRRREAGNVFGGGSRTPIAITFLVKNPAQTAEKASIYYRDIGDYLSQEEKLSMVKRYGSLMSSDMQWQVLEPNEHGDWVDQRNESFDMYISLAPEKKFDLQSRAIFVVQGPGILSSRDAWVYNFSRLNAESNMRRMIDYYNEQKSQYAKARIDDSRLQVDAFIDTNPTRISWTRSLKSDVAKVVTHSLHNSAFRIGAYRPFCNMNLYYDRAFVESPGMGLRLFPESQSNNRLISIPGIGSSKDFSVLMTKTLADYQVQFNNQCFPLYYYEEQAKQSPSLFDAGADTEYIRRDGVSDFILERARRQYGKTVTKEDIFYYVYGFLHSPEYRETFSVDLKKSLPRIPLVDDVRHFWAFSKAGRGLADLHVNYESVPAYPGLTVTGAESGFFTVEKMRFPQKGQKDTILYNSRITVFDIPAVAYEYVVNGKSAIEWIMERYQVTVHSESGIRNDPNDWAKEVGNPRYILDLLLSIVNVSVQTVEIVKGLPKLSF